MPTSDRAILALVSFVAVYLVGYVIPGVILNTPLPLP